VVYAREVHHLQGEQLLLEVVRLPEGAIEPVVPEGHSFLPRNVSVERRLAWSQATPRDLHHVKGAGVEDVEAVAPHCNIPAHGLTGLIGYS
jgi:hypothetical protein